MTGTTSQRSRDSETRDSETMRSVSGDDDDCHDNERCDQR
jgi:hypothetical protein